MTAVKKSLDELLADPQTREPLRRASAEELAELASRLRDGSARRPGGTALPNAVDGAYVSRDGRWFYPDADGVPSLLIDERIELD